MNIINVKIYVIEKATEWANNLMQFLSNMLEVDSHNCECRASHVHLILSG